MFIPFWLLLLLVLFIPGVLDCIVGFAFLALTAILMAAVPIGLLLLFCYVRTV